MADPVPESFDYHAPTPVAPVETVTANLNMTINGVGLQTKVPVPKGPTTLRVLLPVFRAFAEAFVHAASETAAANKQPVSCRAHCGACCRQLVPITEPEAYQLRELIAALPEPRRTVVQGRFAEAKARLQAAGLYEKLTDLRVLESAEIPKMGATYFQQRIACPFLEEESCSIHPERPLACREYLVASDPKHCQEPQRSAIIPVQPAAKVSVAVAQTNPDPPGSRGRHVALIALLDWTQAHPEGPATRTGPELFSEMLSHLTGKRLAANPPAKR